MFQKKTTQRRLMACLAPARHLLWTIQSQWSTLNVRMSSTILLKSSWITCCINSAFVSVIGLPDGLIEFFVAPLFACVVLDPVSLIVSNSPQSLQLAELSKLILFWCGLVSYTICSCILSMILWISGSCRMNKLKRFLALRAKLPSSLLEQCFLAVQFKSKLINS